MTLARVRRLRLRKVKALCQARELEGCGAPDLLKGEERRAGLKTC